MEFLDLTDATDSEKREIEEILSTKNVIDGLELPFESVYLKKSSLITSNNKNTTNSTDQPNNIHPNSSSNNITNGTTAVAVVVTGNSTTTTTTNNSSSNNSVKSENKAPNANTGPIIINNGANNNNGNNNVCNIITNTNTNNGKVTLSKNKGKRRGGGNTNNAKCDVQVNGVTNCDINGRRNNNNHNVNGGLDLSGKMTNGQTGDGHETDSSSSDASSYHQVNGGVNGVNPLGTTLSHHQQPLQPQQIAPPQQQPPPVTNMTTIAPTNLQPLPHGHPVYPMVTPISVITSMSSLAPHHHAAYNNAPPNTEVLQGNVLRPGQGTNVTANAVTATGASIPFPYSLAPHVLPGCTLPSVTTGGHNVQGHTFAAHTSSNPHHQPIYPSPYFPPPPPPYHYVFLPFPHGPPHSPHHSHGHPGANSASHYHPSHHHQVPLVSQMVTNIEDITSSNTPTLPSPSSSSSSNSNNSNNNTNIKNINNNNNNDNNTCKPTPTTTTTTTQVKPTGPSEIFKEPVISANDTCSSSSLVFTCSEEEEKQEKKSTINGSNGAGSQLATTQVTASSTTSAGTGGKAGSAIIESPDDSSCESVSSITANTSTCPLSSPPNSCLTDCSVPSTISSPVNSKENSFKSDNNHANNTSPTTSTNTYSTKSTVTSSISSSEDEENTVSTNKNKVTTAVVKKGSSSSSSSSSKSSNISNNNSIPPVDGPKSWSSLFKSSSRSTPNSLNKTNNNNNRNNNNNTSSASLNTSSVNNSSDSKMAPANKQYKHVCLGGTFDTIHQGHHKLLSQAVAICTDKLTVGVTDESMVSKKTLAELIRPTQVRIDDVKNYLGNICKEQGKKLTLNIVPISDPFGPAIVDETINAIVVSEETIPGGKKINEIRKSKGLIELDMLHIDLIQASNKEVNLEENKISSSTSRLRKLGTLICEPNMSLHNSIPFPPYLIGLTGGIASGKSGIANELAKLGAGIIDSDKLAHSSYEKGSETYKQIIAEFGSDIIDGESQQINRRKLGEKVFSNPQAKSKLETIVWPATRKLVENEIRRLNVQEKKNVIVIEAAQLIEAKWSERIHQIWVTFVPEGEAIKRMIERNGLTADEAKKRVTAQMSNKERLTHANVIFCTLWDRTFTHQQVLKAWDMLHKKFLKE